MSKFTREQGFVSIFSLLFFMVFITIITVGFLRLVVQEQQQATDNSASASALAAAKAGIEDGKRVILYYNLNPSEQARLQSVFPQCTGVFRDQGLQQALGLRSDGRVAQNGTEEINQFYSCLTIDPVSSDYVGSGIAGRSRIIPLTAQSGTVKAINLNWHNTSGQQDGDGEIKSNYGLLGKTTLPTQSEWQSNGGPAFMRLQLIAVPKSGFTSAAVQERTLFLSADALPNNNPAVRPAAFPDSPGAPTAISCSNGATYACQTFLTSSLLGNDSFYYYLRVTPLYGNTHYQVILNGETDPQSRNYLNFNGVQPTIDSTGRTGDVFRRLQARVTLDSDATGPEYAIESGADLCKSFYVTNDNIDFSNDGGICKADRY